MVPLGFDQTNGRVSGLGGDDGGALAPTLPETTVAGFVQKLMIDGRRGDVPVDRDPSVTPYSEERAV